MKKDYSDVFIIGGGINGAGIAADVALRGLSVTLCEKNDLASATSSASSKLIHGGLRYLETYDFSLVRAALEEREILLKIAPHLISPLEFVLPHQTHLRPAWLIRLGLFLYDHLAAHPSLPNSKKVNLRNNARGTALKKAYKLGFSYYDCFADDARLVITNALAAHEKEGSILTRTECVSAHYENSSWRLTLKKTNSSDIFHHQAKVLINAGGPWVEQIQKNIIHTTNDFSIELVKGSHITVPKLYDGDFAYILQNADNRIVFAIPFQKKFTLIGTTDVAYSGDLSDVKLSIEEQTYLLETINHYFEKKLSPADICWSYAGVRCLQRDDKHKLSAVSRDYKIQFNKESALLTVISGKMTTYRRLAKEAVDSLKAVFPHLPASTTASTPLPGGDLGANNFVDFYAQVRMDYPWLPENMLCRLAKNYGSRMAILLQNISSLAEMGEEFAPGLYQKEVEYLMKYEWAETAEDILWRRTKLGLFFTEEETQKLVNWFALRV